MTATSRLRRFGRRFLPVPVVAACGLTAAVVVAGVAHAATVGSPVGDVNAMAPVAGGMLVSGWTFDPNAPKQANAVTGWVDGKPVTSFVAANTSRPDVARAYPAAGALHGFGIRVPVPQGRHTVCVHAANIGPGSAVSLACRTATFSYGPIGSVDILSASVGAVRLAGWALDGDASTTPLRIRVTIDGAVSTILANAVRRDVAARHPNTGTTHGFTATFPVAQGTHQVCVTAMNIGYGSNTTLACRTLTLDDRPVVSLNSPQTVSGKLRLWGWAFDRDAPTTPLTTVVRVDSKTPITLTANKPRSDVARAYPGVGSAHGFDTSVAVSEGTHTVCAIARNIGYGSDRSAGCRTVVVSFSPTASVSAVTPTATGLTVQGWASDPDTSQPIRTQIQLDGRLVTTVTANGKGGTHSGHAFTATLTTTSGRHTVCAIGINVLWGTHNSSSACATTTVALSPVGAFESLTRAPNSNDLAVRGWAFDPDTTGALTVTGTVDGVAVPAMRASALRTDIAARYPTLGSSHGLSVVLPAGDGEHRVCLVAINVGGGSNLSLGCKVINAVHPVAPAAPGNVRAVAGYGGATISWTTPGSDGGAPLTSYTVTSAPGNVSVTVPAGTTSAVVVGLKASTSYTFAVRALNTVGASTSAVSAAAKTQAGPPAQRTPAPISTSRYIRNVRGSSAAELATMRSEGATDAAHNPAGHGYLVLLDIGGQDAYDGGVVLSATTRFVSYYDLVRDVQAYLDGYASAQHSSAPVVIAIGTNNDMDVSAATGKVWATSVVNPLASYARRHVGMTIAGANDIEPGFTASYGATKNWLTGYLAATGAPFVFNGSADGCAWTTTNRSCNNGWTMAGLHYLAAAAAPTRMMDLPQIYNTTMADQWKYISLTGVVNGLTRINFAGVLTEATACAQSGGGCGSLSGTGAWTQMWDDLQSDPRLKVSSLPYATDLRIDS